MQTVTTHLRTGPAARACRREAAGFSVLYITIIITVLVAFGSLAVDFGRVSMAKTQLRQAADAAARAAVTQLGSPSAAQDLAVQYAAYNNCDGVQVAVDRTKDIDFGYWDTAQHTFTVLTGAGRSAANAIRVYCRRTGTNGIPLILGGVIGKNTCDINNAYSIAAVVPQNFGMVGLSFIKLNGNSTASYWSSTGSVGGNAGSIASNGSISSTGNSTIQGTVWTMPGITPTGVTGTASKTLTAALSYPNGDATPYSTTNNDNTQIGGTYTLNVSGDFSVTNNKTAWFTGSNYVFRNVSISSGGALWLTGPTTIYYYGTFTMSGQTSTASNLPKNLKIVGIPVPGTGAAPGALTLSSGASLYANIYAPQSDITLSGSGSIYGSILGKSVTMSGSSSIYYDLSDNGSNGAIQVVQ